MAKDSGNLAKRLETESSDGVLSGLLAEEDEFDRRTLWRLGSWAVGSVGAVVAAILASQLGMRHEQIASADLARQSQQIEQVAKETQSEARRLASAIDTLNSDRDRLYVRIGVLEQGLDSVTGAISRQNPQLPSPPTGTPAASTSVIPPNLTQSAAAQNAASSSIASTSTASANAAAAPPASTATTSAPPAPAPAQSTEAGASAPKPASAPVVSAVSGNTAPKVEKPPIVASSAEPGPTPASSAVPSTPTVPPTVAPSASLVASKSMMGPPDPAAGKLIEPIPPPKVIMAAPIPDVVASASPTEEVSEEEQASPAPKLAVQRTEFGVDVGGANSIPGLRALWRGLLRSRSNAPLVDLRPIIVIRENRNGLGMQLRLVAGPVNDAAAAAKICAAMMANDRTCTTTVFEGQRLTMNADEQMPAVAAAAATQPADANSAPDIRPAGQRRYAPKRASPKEEPAQKPEQSTISQIFGRRQ